MIYYRCDCCGKEQEIKRIGVHRTRNDPMGLEGQYHTPPEVRHLGEDVCKDCYEALYRERTTMMEDHEKQLTHELVEWFKALRKKRKDQ
jgi:hypothetical protein